MIILQHKYKYFLSNKVLVFLLSKGEPDVVNEQAFLQQPIK